MTDVADLLDIEYLLKAKPGGAYLFPNSQAYDEEQMVDLVRLWNWADHLGLRLVGLEASGRGPRGEVTKVTPVPGFHASGHAGQTELVQMVREVKPRLLVPIHTEDPRQWLGLLGAEEWTVECHP